MSCGRQWRWVTIFSLPFGESHHLSLKIDGNRFKGYDYGGSSHFNGRVNGRSISLYDCGECAYSNYSI